MGEVPSNRGVTLFSSPSPTLPHFLHFANVHQHRGLFLTHPPLHTLTESDTSFNFSGTLFHAAYASSTWNLDQRPVRDVSTSHSLVLLYRLGTLDPSLAPIADQFSRIRAILASVPLGKEARERELGPKKGNAVLGGYDCVIWTTDAVAALLREGVVDFGGRSVGMAPVCLSLTSPSPRIPALISAQMLRNTFCRRSHSRSTLPRRPCRRKIHGRRRLRRPQGRQLTAPFPLGPPLLMFS